MNEILSTERLLLREITEDDLPVLFRIFSDPESMRHYPSVKSFDETVAWFRMLAFDSYAAHGFGLWGIVEKASGELVGDCGITLQQTPFGTEPEIGYHLRREWLGRGYATEAACACRDHALGTLDFPRVVSIVSPQNTPSLHVAARVHQGWSTYATVTSADLEVDRVLFASARGGLKSDRGERNATTKAAMAEVDAMILIRRRAETP